MNRVCGSEGIDRFGGWPVPVQPSVYSINRTEPKPWSAFLKPCILQLLLKNTQDNSIIVFVWILPHNFANYKCCWMKKENPREKHKIGYIGFRVLILLKHEMEKGNPNLGSSPVMRKEAETMVSPPSFKGLHTGPTLI